MLRAVRAPRLAQRRADARRDRARMRGPAAAGCAVPCGRDRDPRRRARSAGGAGAGAAPVRRRAVSAHRLVFASVAVALVAVLLRTVQNGGALPLAGRYSNVGSAHANPLRVLEIAFHHLAELDLALGVVPFVGALLAALRARALRLSHGARSSSARSPPPRPSGCCWRSPSTPRRSTAARHPRTRRSWRRACPGSTSATSSTSCPLFLVALVAALRAVQASRPGAGDPGRGAHRGPAAGGDPVPRRDQHVGRCRHLRAGGLRDGRARRADRRLPRDARRRRLRERYGLRLALCVPAPTAVVRDRAHALRVLRSLELRPDPADRRRRTGSRLPSPCSATGSTESSEAGRWH